MKRKSLMFALVFTLAITMVACGNKDNNEGTEQLGIVEITDEVDAKKVKEEILPEGMYRSELTNELISEELKDQRPIAVMVDNESSALPHFGVANADIVYELMNSTDNDRITRLMVIQKDWKEIEQLGNVRSARPTNYYLMWEYNTIFCHDGGPVAYLPPYNAKEYTDELDGIFSRFVDNGKRSWENEYVTSEDLERGISNTGISEEYIEEYYEGPHFLFTDEVNQITFEEDPDAISVTKIELPFEHNGSYLVYDEETQLYQYGEYGELHIDELNDGIPTAFKNVIIQRCTFDFNITSAGEPDAHGYMTYNVIDSGLAGYYITNGKANPITWEKRGNTKPTQFFDAVTGEEIVLNTGKTYITLVPDDVWGDLVIK
jgi:hypothetical protein